MTQQAEVGRPQEMRSAIRSGVAFVTWKTAVTAYQYGKNERKPDMIAATRFSRCNAKAPVNHRRIVRNMGNFNLFPTHVLTFFLHVEQCCYPSFLITPHIPAMTSHVAYVIYATFTLITTQRRCNITFSPYVFLSFMHLGPYFSYILYLSPSFHIHVALLTLYRIRNQVYLSTRNRSRLNAIFDGFLKTTQNLITNLRAHPHLYADPIAQLRGVDTQVTTDDPMGIVCKNTTNDLRETRRRPFPNTNCWNRKSLHSFRNRERLRTADHVRVQKAARETLRLYDFVLVASQLLRRGVTFGALQAS